MAYSDLLKDPKWQKRRLEIMQRDNFTCQWCKDTESTLNVHHLIYEKGKKPWEYSDKFLITLCSNCHEQEGTEYRKPFDDSIINTLKGEGYSCYDLELLEMAFNRENHDTGFTKQEKGMIEEFIQFLDHFIPTDIISLAAKAYETKGKLKIILVPGDELNE